MFKEVNKLSNEKLVEVDARTVAKAGNKLGRTGKNVAKGGWAFMKDVGLNITDILANDGKDSAHYTDDFRKEIGKQGEAPKDSFNDSETRNLMQRIHKLDLKTKEEVRDVLLGYKKLLGAEDEAIKAKKNAPKEQKPVQPKQQSQATPQQSVPQQPSKALESFLLVLEANAEPNVSDDEIKKILANVSKHYFWKKGDEVVRKIVNTFKDVKVPSNAVTKYWASKGKPNTKLRLYNMMKALELNDKQIGASFKDSGVELTHADLKRMNLNSKSLLDPKTIDEPNLLRLAKNLASSLNLRKFIRELTASIKAEKRKIQAEEKPTTV